MKQFFNALSGRRCTKKSSDRAVTKSNICRPTASFFAIGDIHGRYDLLCELLSQIDPDNNQQLIFLGDYVDRGPASAQVLEHLYRMAQERPERVVCLLGNHEKMMLEFIDDPLGRGARWLRNGGVDTLRSYGIAKVSARLDPDEAMEACDALETAMPNGLAKWLSGLPTTWNSGNMWCVHAAMDPEVAPEDQKTKTLVWGHQAFMNTIRQDNICVVHGHTVVDKPTNSNSRVSVDTGAYHTGRLTAAHITETGCSFVTA